MRAKELLDAILARLPWAAAKVGEASEIVVMVRPFAHPNDPDKDALLLKVGHVIDCVPAAWRYGESERKNANWYKYRVNGMPVMYGKTLCTQQHGDRAKYATKIRHVRLDLNKLPAAKNGAVKTITFEQLRDAMVVEPLVPLHDYIGAVSPEVIS